MYKTMLQRQDVNSVFITKKNKARSWHSLERQQKLNTNQERDNHSEIGGMVDVTSNYELESAEMLRKSGQELTPETWLVKILMGGIDDSYDEKDE